MLLPVWKQHQSKVSAAQLNGARGHIYLTITFAVLIFMIKTIRHLWVACARALRLTTIVKQGAIRGFTGMPVSSVCDAAQPLMEMSLPGEFVRGHDTNIVCKASVMKAQRIIGTGHTAFSFFPPSLISFMSACVLSSSQATHRLDTSLYSCCCLKEQPIL